MIQISGDKRLMAKLTALENANKRTVSYGVGFAAPYAVYVHENLGISHPIHNARDCGGEAKFLQNAVVATKAEVIRVIAQAQRRGQGMQKGVLDAANVILGEAKIRVPVLTGRLRDSGYIVSEKV